MIEKYEFFIEEHFEPYAAMHESRQHSNLWGKMVLWGDIDNDGDRDLFVGYRLAPNRFYLNNGNAGFTEIASASGLPCCSIAKASETSVNADLI